jgi:hypothetical protein
MEEKTRNIIKKSLFLLGLLVLLVPLGLLADAPAWGEWEAEYYKKILGFVPEGIVKALTFRAPFPDYTVSGAHPVLSYYLSAIIGVVVLLVFFQMLKLILKKDGK